jgi:hypothetical protein
MTTILKVAAALALAPFSDIPSLEAAGLERTQRIVTQSPAGVITGLTGTPLLGTIGGATRDLSLGDAVSVAEKLRTGQDDILEVLWDRHTLILVRPRSTVLIHESQAGKAEVVVRDGSVSVALAYGGHPSLRTSMSIMHQDQGVWNNSNILVYSYTKNLFTALVT